MAVELYKGKIPIVRSDLNQGFIRGDVPDPEHLSTGAVPRDFSVHPLEMRDSPGGMKLYSDSEWDALYDAGEANEDSLEHLFLRGDKPAFDLLDQNGFPDCATADTEVLTERGWTPWPEYDARDLLATVNPVTHAMEFQPCLRKHVKEYDGPMVYSTNRRVDFGMTPNHRMYVRKWDERARKLSSGYSFVLAKDLGWYSGLLAAPSGFIGTDLVEVEVPGDRRYDGDDFVAMVALVVSDGYAGGSPSTKNWVSFCCFDERYPSVVALAARVGFSESPSRKGVFTRYGAGALAEWVRQHCYTAAPYKSHTKKVPAIFKEISARQIVHFLASFGDRNIAGRCFYSSSKRIIDDLQELHLRVGKRAAVTERTSPSHEGVGKTFKESHGYVLVVGQTDRLCLDKKKHIETDKYKGLVYCATVENSTLVTRRNGTVLISGNCWCHSTAHAIMLDCVKQNIDPVPRLNAVAAATLMNRTNGGWCGLSMKFAREKGFPAVGPLAPYQSRRVQNTAELQAEMVRHRDLEDWYDLAKAEYDQDLTKSQLATCLFDNLPSPSDYNRFGHSMLSLRLVRIERGSWGLLTLNSWKGFGYFGLCVLAGMWPDGSCALRSSTPTT